jgi:hypothetical protein
MRAERGWLVVLAAAALLSGCEQVYGPTAPSREWQAYDTARFTLFTRPATFCESAAASLGEVLEDQYSYATSALHLSAGPRISMFLYNSRQDVTPVLPSDRSGVAFPETNAVHAVCVAPLDDNLKSLLLHEANHVVMQNALGRPGTSFVNEGLASAVMSERYGLIGPTFLYGWTDRNRSQVPRLADLVDDAKWSSSSDVGYKSSASFLAFLLDRDGPDPLRQLYYARSADFAARSLEIYGRPLEALEQEWLAFVGVRGHSSAPVR